MAKNSAQPATGGDRGATMSDVILLIPKWLIGVSLLVITGLIAYSLFISGKPFQIASFQFGAVPEPISAENQTLLNNYATAIKNGTMPACTFVKTLIDGAMADNRTIELYDELKDVEDGDYIIAGRIWSSDAGDAGPSSRLRVGQFYVANRGPIISIAKMFSNGGFEECHDTSKITVSWQGTRNVLVTLWKVPGYPNSEKAPVPKGM